MRAHISLDVTDATRPAAVLYVNGASLGLSEVELAKLLNDARWASAAIREQTSKPHSEVFKKYAVSVTLPKPW